MILPGLPWQWGKGKRGAAALSPQRVGRVTFFHQRYCLPTLSNLCHAECYVMPRYEVLKQKLILTK